MIRINLLPAKDAKRRRAATGGGGGNVAAIFAVVLLMEMGGMGYWYTQASAAAESSGQGGQDLQGELDALKKTAVEITELTTLQKENAKQRVVFKGLEDGKLGPISALLFMAYALRRVDASLPEEEYRDISDVWSGERHSGGSPTGDNEWNPDRVWITKYTEDDGSLSIEGSAKDHEDVMTFLRRMRTSIYFDALDMVFQKAITKSPLGQSYVDFKLTCFLNYDPEGFPPLDVVAEAGKK